jgi:hypothetical protein
MGAEDCFGAPDSNLASPICFAFQENDHPALQRSARE